MSDNRSTEGPGAAPIADFRPRMLPTAVGSMPQADPHSAWEMVRHHLPDFPAWPQFPNRTFLENMYVQQSEGFPDAVLQGEDRIYEDTSGGRDGSISSSTCCTS